MSRWLSPKYRWRYSVSALALLCAAVAYYRDGESPKNGLFAPSTNQGALTSRELPNAPVLSSATADDSGNAKSHTLAATSQGAYNSVVSGPYGGIGLPDVGSEGFGGLVQRAIHSDDPRLALQAFFAIRLCKFAKGDVQRSYERVHASPDAGTQWALAYDIKRDKQCQTLAAEQYSIDGELAEKALLGGVPGAGSAVFVAQGLNIKPSLIPAVRRSLESEGLDGNATAFMILSTDGVLNVDAIDRYAYQMTWRTLQSLTSIETPSEEALMEILSTIQDHNSSEANKQSAGARFFDVLFRTTKPNLTDAEQASAKTKARELLVEIASRQHSKSSRPKQSIKTLDGKLCLSRTHLISIFM